MKYAAGILFVLIGLLLVGLSVTLHVQFSTVVTQADPNFDEYPLLRPFIPDSAASDRGGALAPDKAAETVTFRIYGVGAVGVINVVGGALVLLFTIRNRADGKSQKELRK